MPAHRKLFFQLWIFGAAAVYLRGFLMLEFATLIKICHKCDSRQRICAGPCPCLIDRRDIIDHARAGDCPLGHYADAVDIPESPTSAHGGEMPSVPPIEVVGPALWRAMHTEADPNPAYVAAMLQRLPCGRCKDHFAEILNSNPPTFSTRRDYFLWTWKVHNLVNAALNKPVFSLEDADRLYPQ